MSRLGDEVESSGAEVGARSPALFDLRDDAAELGASAERGARRGAPGDRGLIPAESGLRAAISVLGIPGWLPGLVLLGAWASLVAVVLATRPLISPLEVRYLSVAWEMWVRGESLVPHLNGELYSHKPPLLFWLIQLGWWIFGINEWWPRLVAPSFAVLDLWLCARLARLLWPDCPRARKLAPGVLLGSVGWLAYTTLTMADMLVVSFVLLVLIGLLRCARGRSGWWLVSLGMGLGLLAKGPVVFLFALPVGLLARWWAPALADFRWYGWLSVSMLGGIALALVWVVPAALAAGPDFATALLWEQAAGRLVDSFAHAHAWWWYLLVVPIALLPWSGWPALWRASCRAGWGGGDLGVRFSLACLVPSFLLLSLVSGKQPHYLLPLLPSAACLIGRALSLAELRGEALPMRAPGFLLAGIGAALVSAPGLAVILPDVVWLPDILPVPGVVILALGVAFMAARTMSPSRSVFALTLSVAIVFGALHLSASRATTRAWDVSPTAKILALGQAQGRPVAHLWRYYGQYQFTGRLTQPLTVLVEAQIEGWVHAHPDGLVVGNHRLCERGYRRQPLYSQPFRGGMADVWESSMLRDDASLVWDPCSAIRAVGRNRSTPTAGLPRPGEAMDRTKRIREGRATA